MFHTTHELPRQLPIAYIWELIMLYAWRGSEVASHDSRGDMPNPVRGVLLFARSVQVNAARTG